MNYVYATHTTNKSETKLKALLVERKNKYFI